MELKYASYQFTPVLGWSITRYETFDKCRRQYFYQYYAKYVPGVPRYRMDRLRALTSTALEVGNVVHDVLEAFLRRLQKNDSGIDTGRFIEFARRKTLDYFSTKTFIETVYWDGTVDRDRAFGRVERCLNNFLASPTCTWIFMKAITNKKDWMIEPPGYGETRIEGMKAYCKMDFLFPVDNEVVILDWKTGKRDEYKHAGQILGYAAAAHNNFGIPWNVIFPKIVYLYPEFSELEIRPAQDDYASFCARVRRETDEMYACCSDPEQNVPLHIDKFPKSPSEKICAYCNYQELCFPDRRIRPGGTGKDEEFV